MPVFWAWTTCSKDTAGNSCQNDDDMGMTVARIPGPTTIFSVFMIVSVTNAPIPIIRIMITVQATIVLLEAMLVMQA